MRIFRATAFVEAIQRYISIVQEPVAEQKIEQLRLSKPEYKFRRRIMYIRPQRRCVEGNRRRDRDTRLHRQCRRCATIHRARHQQCHSLWMDLRHKIDKIDSHRQQSRQPTAHESDSLVSKLCCLVFRLLLSRSNFGQLKCEIFCERNEMK